MKWIRTEDGEKAHIVWRSGAKTTLCGIRLVKEEKNFERAIEVVDPGPNNRCEDCDNVWRAKRWLRIRLGPAKRDPVGYTPRYHLIEQEDDE